MPFLQWVRASGEKTGLLKKSFMKCRNLSETTEAVSRSFFNPKYITHCSGSLAPSNSNYNTKKVGV
jgi:hypothetical protein